MDQALIDYLMEMGAMQPEQQDIERQRAMVEQLRDRSALPGMRNVGRLAQAANPLEFMASVGNTYAAQQRERGADEASKAMMGKRRSALESYRKRLPGASPTGIVPPAGGGSPYGDDPYAVGGW